MAPRCYSFIGGDTGRWRIESVRSIIGDGLGVAARLDIVEGDPGATPPGSGWALRGVVSNARYTNRDEQDRLAAIQPALGRPEATCAALIPITKNAAWWAMSQDERREILAARSAHIATGMRYLPAIARRLHHGRDLGEPFDFLTWFEYAPVDAPAFDELLGTLRQTEEWTYVSREVEIRLSYSPGHAG